MEFAAGPHTWSKPADGPAPPTQEKMMKLTRLTSLPLRTKLTTAIAVPVAGLFALSALEVRDLTNDVSETQAQLAVVESNVTIAEIAAAIRDERDLIVNVMGSSVPADPSEASWNVYYRGIMESTDVTIADALSGPSLTAAEKRSVEDIRQRLEEVRQQNGPDLYAVSTGLAEDLLEGRTAQDADSTMAGLARFDAIVSDTIRLIDSGAGLELDGETALDLTTLKLSSAFDEAIRVEAISYLALSLVPQEEQSAQMVQAARAQGAAAVQLESVIGEIGNTDLAPTFDAFIESSDYESFATVRNSVAVDEIGEIRVARTRVSFVLLALTNELDDIKTDIIDRARATAVENNSSAEQRVLVGGLALAVLVGLVTAITIVLFRSIRRPLLALTNRSRSIADEELPNVVQLLRSEGHGAEVPEIVPIEAESTDEVGELVAAFNDMHRTAVELASEQAASRRTVADMFVNLGRRNQRLLMRILDYLDGLEANEKNPEALEQLFKIDHLATRMRRNAESLIVLAGAREARVFDQPVAIAEVVRSALGEVEGYERVDLDVRTDKLIDGLAVADAAHLLAELIENSLTFSPPSSRVVVSAADSPKGFVIAVADAGIGMTAEAMLEANETITRAMTLEETPSKDLGHHVVGRLAGRHGIRVELREGITDGLVAKVMVPPALLSDPADQVDESLAELFSSASENSEDDSDLDDDVERRDRAVAETLELTVVPELDVPVATEDIVADEPRRVETLAAVEVSELPPIAADAPDIIDTDIAVVDPVAAVWSDPAPDPAPAPTKPMSVAEASRLARSERTAEADGHAAPEVPAVPVSEVPAVPVSEVPAVPVSEVPSVLETTSGFALARRRPTETEAVAPTPDVVSGDQPPLARRKGEPKPRSSSNPLGVTRSPGANLPVGVKPTMDVPSTDRDRHTEESVLVSAGSASDATLDPEDSDAGSRFAASLASFQSGIERATSPDDNTEASS